MAVPDWDGNVVVIEKKAGSGIFTIAPRKDGNYNASTVREAVKAIINARGSVDGWKIWPDGDFSVKIAPGEVVNPTKFLKLVREADYVQLALVKGRWAQPKFRFVKGDGASARKAKDNRRTL